MRGSTPQASSPGHLTNYAVYIADQEGSLQQLVDDALEWCPVIDNAEMISLPSRLTDREGTCRIVADAQQGTNGILRRDLELLADSERWVSDSRLASQGMTRSAPEPPARIGIISDWGRQRPAFPTLRHTSG